MNDLPTIQATPSDAPVVLRRKSRLLGMIWWAIRWLPVFLVNLLLLLVVIGLALLTWSPAWFGAAAR